MARVLLGVTAGIAAYKSLELVRLLTKAGHAVRVVQTPASEQFVGRASFAALGPNILGSAGPTRICSPSQGVPNTYYAAALADKINGAAFFSWFSISVW